MNKFNDILDSYGKELNFLSNLPYSDKYKNLAQAWRQLPIYLDKNVAQKFFNYIKNYQVILISSGTSSGKTVIIPKYYLKYNVLNNINGKIAITNPKTITTLKNAQYGADTLDVTLGNEVGYKFRNSPKNSTNTSTKLIYVTDGYLSAVICNKDKLLTDFSGIIIDEAHERQIQIDLLLKLIKEILLVRPDFRLIIMSATIDTTIFKKYYDIEGIKYIDFFVKGGANFPIEQIWSSTNATKDNYNIKIEEACKDLINNKIKLSPNINNDILVFVPKQRDTIIGCNFISKHFKSANQLENTKKIICIEIYSKVSHEIVSLATSPDEYKQLGYNIKIIFATNVAESSITFSKLLYVIDTGFEIKNTFDPELELNVIDLHYTSQAQIIQRIGRTGRTNPGIAYHLYTKKKFDSLHKFPIPEILNSDLTEHIIPLLYYNKTLSNLQKFFSELLSPPTTLQIKSAFKKLKQTKTIVKYKNDIQLSKIGLTVMRYKNISLYSAIALILSSVFNCSNEIAIIIGIIESCEGFLNKLFNIDFKHSKNVELLRQNSYTNSDHITLLYIYNNLWKNDKTAYLREDVFRKAETLIKELTRITNKIPEFVISYIKKKYKLNNLKLNDKIEDNILMVLKKAYSSNIIKDNILLKNNLTGKIDFLRITKITKQKSPSYIICNEPIKIFNKVIFRCCSVIPNEIINKN